jgi:hypothetical protein
MAENCCICGRDFEKNMTHVIQLTAEEKEYVLKNTGKNEERFVYCKPCFRILNDRDKGASLIRSVMEIDLNSSGHPRAKEMASSFVEALRKKAKVLDG